MASHFQKGVVYILKDFSCWTSTHGVPHIGMANATWLRVIWILVTIGAFCLFLYQFYNLLTTYLAYAVNTETTVTLRAASPIQPSARLLGAHVSRGDDVPSECLEVVSEERVFRALGSGLFSLREKEMQVSAYNSAEASPTYGFPDAWNSERQSLGVAWTTLYNEKIRASDDAAGGVLGYDYDDLILSCTYDANTCNSSSVSPKILYVGSDSSPPRTTPTSVTVRALTRMDPTRVPGRVPSTALC